MHIQEGRNTLPACADFCAHASLKTAVVLAILLLAGDNIVFALLVPIKLSWNSPIKQFSRTR